MLLMKNCRFVRVLTEGFDGSEGDVLIKDGCIEMIAPCDTIHPDGSEVLDLQGKTLMPGLIDMHVHLIMTDHNYSLDNMLPTEFSMRCMEFASAMLDMGYTTIRDAGDNHSRPTIALSRAIDSGKLVGPTIIPAGPILCPTAPNTSDWLAERIDGVENTRRMARRSLLLGGKYLKLYGSASMHAPTKETGYPIIEPEEIREAVKVAKNYSTYVSIHCHGARAIDNAVRAGVHTVEHASMISEETLQYIDKSGEDIGIVPTLSVFYGSVSGGAGNNEETRVRSNRIKGTVIESLKNAYRHGVRIGWGTDVVKDAYVDDPSLEFRLRKEWLEYKDADIIQQATINSAKLLYMDDKIGSVRAGKRADLIVVDGDPSEDITVMYQRPLHVIKNGTIIR